MIIAGSLLGTPKNGDEPNDASMFENKQATNTKELAVNFFLTTTYQQSPVWSIEANGEMAILSQLGIKDYERICIYTRTSREQTAIKQMH